MAATSARASPSGPGETATFVLDRVEPGPYSDADIAAEFDATVAFWRRWLRQSRRSGRNQRFGAGFG